MKSKNDVVSQYLSIILMLVKKRREALKVNPIWNVEIERSFQAVIQPLEEAIRAYKNLVSALKKYLKG